MITTELIEQVRAKLDGATDYKIAQVLEISKQKVSAMRKGTEKPDAYDCARMAEILERDPLEVIAQVEAEAARTEKKRQYWRSFFSGLKRTAHAIAWCGIAIGSGEGLAPGHAEAAAAVSSHNGRFCSSFAALGRWMRSWWTTKYGFFSGWSGFCGC
jgi:transcriptional regulator with XRE-family HTH domain